MTGMKKGFTLIETTIAISLLSICVIGFLEALNVAMLGTDQVRQNNAAAEIARSQMEYIQQRVFIVHNDSEQNKYGDIPESELASGFTAANINTTVNNVSGMDNRAIQQITVNVSYSGGKHHMELTDYKTPRLASLTGGGQGGWPVTERVQIPTLPCDGGCLIPWLFCCRSGDGERWGYYYTFETGTTTHVPGPISVNWQFQCFAFKTVMVYLYNESGREKFPTGDKGLIRMTPPTPYVSVATSRWYEGANREVCDLEMTGLAPGTYLVYFFNSGLGENLALELPPSQGTITYIK